MTNGIADVLNAAADRIEAMPDYAAEHALRNAGGFVFAELFEQARQVFGLPAIVALERHLRLGQLQHWQQPDRAEVVAALRAAAKEPTVPDAETVALRRELDELHFTLADAVGLMPWAAVGTSPSVLVREVADRIGRLEAERDKARAEHDKTRVELWTAGAIIAQLRDEIDTLEQKGADSDRVA